MHALFITANALPPAIDVRLQLDDVRWAAAEGVSETVIATVLLLHQRRVDEIVPKLSAAELEQVIVLVGRSPRVYPPGTLDALKQRRTSTLDALKQRMPPSDSRARDQATNEPAGQSINGTGSPQMDRAAARISHEAEHQRRLAMLRARTPQRQ